MRNQVFRGNQRTIILSAILIFTAMGAMADGFYIPPVAVEDYPDMPRQRAVIIYRDGVEELLVESDFDGVGERMAWIVPVPNEPTSLEVGSAGVFRTLELGLPRSVVGGFDLRGFHRLVVLLLLLLSLFMLMRSESFSLIGFAITCFIIFMLFFIMVPNVASFSGGGGSAVVDVTVIHAEQVGGYEVNTLHAKTGDGLTQWLADNGFQSLPEGGEGVVEDYIEDGWFFVTAKLQREGNGYARPHPLSITFPTETPVYPMRLTRLANTELYLDLYVIAAERAQAAGMKTLLCDRILYSVEEKVIGLKGPSSSRPSRIEFPWLTERVQHEEVITHLRDKLAVQDMDRDISIQFKAYAAKHPTLFFPDAMIAARVVFFFNGLRGDCNSAARTPDETGSCGQTQETNSVRSACRSHCFTCHVVARRLIPAGPGG